MAEVAALSLEVRSDQVKDATVALRELPKAASAAERAAEKWSKSTQEAARSTEDFSRRVRKTIADLEFERQQLARSATERARYAALRRAGVAEASAEGQAISASVRALQAQQSAQRKTADETKRSAEAAREFASQWSRLLAIGAGTMGASTILKAADAFTILTNSIKVSGAEGASLAFVQERLFAAANKNGVEIVALGQLYSRTALAGKELGISQERLLEFVDGVTAALRVQGGSTEAARGALLQLSQALGAGVVRAEEFNSILEGALPIAQAAARGMEGMGGSVAKLRTAILAGTVTSKQFFEATERGFVETRKVAAGASLTIGQSMTALSNAFTNYIGQADKASGVSASLAKAIASVGKALDEAGKDAAAGDGGLFTLPKMFQSTVKELEGIIGFLDRLDKEISDFAIRAGAAITDFVDDFNAGGAGAVAGFIEAFRSLPEALTRLFINAWEAARAATAKGINALTAMLPDWMGLGGGTKFDETSRNSGGSVGDVIGARIKAASDAASAQMREEQARLKALNRQAAMVADEERARRGGMPTSGPLGLGGSPATTAAGKAAENAAKKYAELATELELARASQDKMTEAARRGEVQFQEQEATLEAQKKLLDIFGKVLDETDPRLRKVRDLLLSLAQGKVAEAFNVATTELQKQNVILEAQIRLMNEAPEIQAREIALIKVKQEAEKAGTAVTQEMIDARQKAIEQNETLKTQAEELKRSQELWTAPLKSALESIQQTAADAFEGMLESGKISFESLKETFTKVLRRMAAEFLALATVRPVMSVLVNAISPSIGGGLGGSGLSLPSWLGGGSLGGFLGSPIFPGSMPAGQFGPPLPGLGGLTWGAGLGALAGAGFGAYQLLSGNGSTASTIGGISSILGAGLSLIPGIGPILGPAVGLLGNLIPGLFGSSTPPTITNQTYGQLTYAPNGWYTTGGAWGPNANASGTESGLRSLTGGIDAVFALLGGVRDAAKVWGLSAQNKTVSGKDWSSSSDSLFLVDPNGNQQLWRMNESNMMDTGSSQLVRQSILGGAVGDISENMRKVVDQIGKTTAATLQELAEGISAVTAFDDAIAGLGKTVTTAEAAIKQIDDSFAAMYATAEKYGLPTNELDAAKQAARLGYATDFGKSLSREILGMTDPMAAALADLDEWRAGILDNNKWLLENVEGSLDQINQIEQLYGLRRAQIVEQAATAALDSLKGALDRLLYGDLSGAAPVDVLAGTKATYMADLAKAFTGDAEAAGRLNSSAADYMQAAQAVYGTSTTAYQQLRRQTIIDVASAYRYNGGQFGDIPAAYDVIMGNSLGALAPAAAANMNAPASVGAWGPGTNGWLGNAWLNSTNDWLAANSNNPALSELASAMAANINAAISAPTATSTNALAVVSAQIGDMTAALQASEERDDELAALFTQHIALTQRIVAKIAA